MKLHDYNMIITEENRYYIRVQATRKLIFPNALADYIFGHLEVNET